MRVPVNGANGTSIAATAPSAAVSVTRSGVTERSNGPCRSAKPSIQRSSLAHATVTTRAGAAGAFSW